MTQVKTLTAQEAYHDCLQFFEEAIKPLSEIENSDSTLPAFNNTLTPLDGFEIQITATHAVMQVFAARYPAAEFTFHEERQSVPGATEADIHKHPLNAQYATFTIDFTPYGTIFGGPSDDNGGNSTKAFAGDSEPVTNVQMPATPVTAPSGPTGPTETPTGVGPSPIEA